MGFRPITEQEFLRIKKMVADSGTVDGTRRTLDLRRFSITSMATCPSRVSQR
jgi:hypothetical protein